MIIILQFNVLQLLANTFKSFLIVIAVLTGLAGSLLIFVESIVITLALPTFNKLSESLISRELPLVY
jgi:hypothetical protein